MTVAAPALDLARTAAAPASWRRLRIRPLSSWRSPPRSVPPPFTVRELFALADAPTPRDARQALNLLSDLLAEFPFASESDKAAGLSALMTPVVRGALGAAPLHVLEAPEAGSGKSYLIDVAAAIAVGETAAVIAAGRNEEESEKRLAAELLTGQSIISIDNLNGDLSGDFLCQLIERPIVRPRVLGKSETKAIPNRVTVFANGNNLRLVGDIVRSAVRCRLDAQLERPELRQFRADPQQAVLADRGKYIAAVLTIVRAYQIAGNPDCLPSLASFGELVAPGAVLPGVAGLRRPAGIHGRSAQGRPDAWQLAGRDRGVA